MDQKTINETNGPSLIPHTAPVMKRTLVVSIFLHVFFLFGLQETFDIQWIPKPLKTYRVELIRPPIDPVEGIKRPKTAVTRSKSIKESKQAETTETISLDTKDKRYVSYVKLIESRLATNWDYPRPAWENLMEGDVFILFTVDRQGRLNNIRILESSPYEILNQETQRTIRVSAPFPPFPDTITVDKLNIKAKFQYRLTGK